MLHNLGSCCNIPFRVRVNPGGVHIATGPLTVDGHPRVPPTSSPSTAPSGITGSGSSGASSGVRVPSTTPTAASNRVIPPGGMRVTSTPPSLVVVPSPVPTGSERVQPMPHARVATVGSTASGSVAPPTGVAGTAAMGGDGSAVHGSRGGLDTPLVASGMLA